MTISLSSSKIAASMLPSSALRGQESKNFNMVFAKAGTKVHPSERGQATVTGHNGRKRKMHAMLADELLVSGEHEEAEEENTGDEEHSKEQSFSVPRHENSKTRSAFLV